MTRIILLVLLCTAACTADRPGNITETRLLGIDSEPANWLSLGRNFMQHHHSPLKRINDANISELGFAWEYATNSNRGKVNRGLEATPIVVDGVMYTSGAWSQVYALDARTGKQIWRFDPEVDGSYGRRACCDVVNRGVQVWNGRVYVGTLDGYLVCLDAATGTLLWKKDTFIDRTAFYTITGPPQIAAGRVVIGNSGAEFGVRGYITAYDAASGDFAWRFFTVPGDPAKPAEHEEIAIAAKTWDPASDWAAGGGGTVWGQMAYDPQLNLLYVGTGNSTPYPSWERSPAGGDNLFLVSILAINPDSGKLVWHYQTTPSENWDYTCTANIVLADLEINGQQRRVLMQAPKNGFFYVLDRSTGELISANNYVPVNWATHIDLKTGRPAVTKHGIYKDKPAYIFPGPAGGHNWQPMSFNPSTGLVYIPTVDLHFIFIGWKDYKFRPAQDNTGVSTPPVFSHRNLPPEFREIAAPWPEPEGEVLKAWDPVNQREVWRQPLVSFHNGGILSTDGNLVFQGTATGKFIVYNATTGVKLKEIETGTGILAAPMTYEVDGEQFVAVMAGYGGPLLFFPDELAALNRYRNTGRILAFRLKGGETPLPEPQFPAREVTAPPDIKTDPVIVKRGNELHDSLCGVCHVGFGEDHHSELPDLSILSPSVHAQFRQIVLGGSLSYYGMASFADVLTEEDADAIHHYLVSVQAARFRKEKESMTRN